jgi:hypothetical protein
LTVCHIVPVAVTVTVARAAKVELSIDPSRATTVFVGVVPLHVTVHVDLAVKKPKSKAVPGPVAVTALRSVCGPYHGSCADALPTKTNTAKQIAIKILFMTLSFFKFIISGKGEIFSPP